MGCKNDLELLEATWDVKIEFICIKISMDIQSCTDSRSAFFMDCLFCDGLEMTLMSLLLNVPISCPPL